MSRDIEQDREWLNDHPCPGSHDGCVECDKDRMARDYMAEVERLQAELADWARKARHFEQECAELRAEVERLKTELQRVDDHNAYEEGLGGR